MRSSKIAERLSRVRMIVQRSGESDDFQVKDVESPVRIFSLNGFRASVPSQSHDYHRQARHEGGDRSECGNVTNKVSHHRLPF